MAQDFLRKKHQLAKPILRQTQGRSAATIIEKFKEFVDQNQQLRDALRGVRPPKISRDDALSKFHLKLAEVSERAHDAPQEASMF